MEFVAELRRLGNFRGERGELLWRNLVALQVAQQKTQAGGETGQAGGGVKEFEIAALLIQQRAQHHYAAFVIEPAGLCGGFSEYVFGETIEGKDLQPRVTVEFGIGEQLAFDLCGGLLGREQQEWRAVWRRDQLTADFREAAEGLAAASGAEQESRLHGDVFNRKRDARQKNKVFYFAGLDGFCPPGLWFNFDLQKPI